jgi:hypothetical protein
MADVFDPGRSQAQDLYAVEVFQSPRLVEFSIGEEYCQLMALPDKFSRQISQLYGARSAQGWKGVGN